MKNSTFFRNTFLAASVALFSSAMISCDNIADDDRYFEVESITPVRSILIEDFTGQDCINCPEAHEVIENLEKQYGDAIVAVSIHAGGLSSHKKRTNFEVGRVFLATDEGQYYDDQIPTHSYPYGVLNGSIGSDVFSSWAGIAKGLLTIPSSLNIDLSAHVNGNDVNVNVELLSEEDMSGQLVVWITENGIVARQKLIDGSTDNEYVHNNVFRAPVNDIDGEAVSLEKDMPLRKSYSIELRDNNQEKWVPENLAIVAFLRTAAGVEQVKKVKVQI
ncbi:MAG: Omp28 family outer membrane lipoprotein [Muribaculaceae bacterium]|nr:Omp28 family outer membrane lipoprotein [Muribaculaceae bacterium]